HAGRGGNAGRALDVADDDLIKAFTTRHHQRAAAVQDEVDAARAEIFCGFRHLRQRLVEPFGAPVVDIAGNADQPDAIRRELVELVWHDFHDGRADIADALAPAEHAALVPRGGMPTILLHCDALARQNAGVGLSIAPTLQSTVIWCSY